MESRALPPGFHWVLLGWLSSRCFVDTSAVQTNWLLLRFTDGTLVLFWRAIWFSQKNPHIPVCIICLFSSNFGMICMFFPWVCLHFSIFPWIFLFFFHAPSRGKGHKWWTVAWTKKEQTKHRWCFSLFVFGFLLTYLFEWFWICLVCFGFCSSCFSGGCVFFPVFPLFLHSLGAL